MIPKKIYLQWVGDSDEAPKDSDIISVTDVTWSRERIFKHDIVYIRSARAALAKQEQQHGEKQRNLGSKTPAAQGDSATQGQKKLGMFPWVQIAIEQGALISICRGGGVNASLTVTLVFPWLDRQYPFEAEARTLVDLLNDLNEQLQDDAAQEMIDAGVV